MDHPSRVGKYEIEKFLGGGMSHVYQARDSVLGRRVALKILTEAGMKDEESKSRFLMEARMASNIAHENIISVYDFGEDQGRPFIVMEFLEGESLRSAIRHHRLGDYHRRLRIALQVARALDYAHSKKIIHRDIKPENIHLDAQGRAKLMDFGIAKSEGVHLTRAGFTLGTPFYMAPEQVLGQPLTPQADVYSFGLLLFELLTGKKAVEGDKVQEIFETVLYKPVNLDPLDDAKVSERMRRLIDRCTAKQPAQRPPGLGPVADEIERMMDPTRLPSSVRDAPGPLVEYHTPTLTLNLPNPLRGSMGFIGKFSGLLKTQTGLMLLAAAAVIFAVMLIYAILKAAHVV
ncbi:MAG TPA: serine/threonine-protein kinase [Bryobacteraceae bacterium]|nr:serine/threonine-protein kinase [Bryobacteraceae bacterium]